MVKGLKPADPQKYYKFAWVDKKVNNGENYRYKRCMQFLGYDAIQAFDDPVQFQNWLR